MRALLVGILCYWWAAEPVMTTRPCLSALKASHEATRAAWAPRFDWSAITSGRAGWYSCPDGWTCDDCGCEPGSVEWHEYEAKRLREKRDREQKARAALDAVDKACGSPAPEGE